MRRSINHQDDRLDLRLSPEAKSMLQRAADVERKSLSAFLLDQAILAAAEILSERTQFRVGATEFDAFCAALEAPTKDRRRLTRLLRRLAPWAEEAGTIRPPFLVQFVNTQM